ncbi:hypothetical protein GGF31_006051 [Allomyces arbusculus]|nr:hypothetical protein GGF31_006051 [Allomyces arbusculus]
MTLLRCLHRKPRRKTRALPAPPPAIDTEAPPAHHDLALPAHAITITAPTPTDEHPAEADAAARARAPSSLARQESGWTDVESVSDTPPATVTSHLPAHLRPNTHPLPAYASHRLSAAQYELHPVTMPPASHTSGSSSYLGLPSNALGAGAAIMRPGTPMPTLADPNPFGITVLGDTGFPTPVESVVFTDDRSVLLYKPFFQRDHDGRMSTSSHGSGHDDSEMPRHLPGHELDVPLYLERAGPRKHLFFNPSHVVAGIVTCGGLCPGLNNVIRGLVSCLFYRYHVKKCYGFRYGYEGLNPAVGLPPIELTPAEVKDIHRFGGSVLGSSRGPQDPKVMVDYLVSLGVNVLFTIGGDGTQKGAHNIAMEAERRGIALSVVGIPKTIDNDIAYCAKTFGFETAVAMSLDPIAAAHEEARAARGGIGIVKLMGRDSGFIALHAALASGDVNLLLLPEVPFNLPTIFAIVEERLRTRDHVLIVVAEGAGQDLCAADAGDEKDKSGNSKLHDVGVFLKNKLGAHLKGKQIEHTIKYIDPSYTIRSAPACATDAVFTVSLAQQAVHAAMAGKTDLIIGQVHDEFVYIPISKAVERRKKVDITSVLYQTLLDNTGMPLDLCKVMDV